MPYLCYINKLGPNYKGELIYEFIFTDDIENVSGDDWDRFPANGYPGLPNDRYITEILMLKTEELDLVLSKDNDFFTYNDCKDGIVAMAWEEYSYDNRFIIKFGEDIDTLKDKFYKRDLSLEKIN